MTTNAAVNDDSNYNDYNDDRNHNQRNKACGKTRGSCLGRFATIMVGVNARAGPRATRIRGCASIEAINA